MPIICAYLVIPNVRGDFLVLTGVLVVVEVVA